MTIFGIRLDAPLAEQIPRCTTSSYALVNEVICWAPALAGDDQIGPYQIGIRDKERPAGVRDIEVVEIDGKVQGVTASTLGESYQEDLLKQLTEKFGKPSRIARTRVVNGFGVHAVRVEAAWRRREFTVEFFGFESDIKWGRLVVGTNEYLAREARKDRDRAGARTRM